ncbi:hypothetical protein [Deinococcus humi]|uniref:Uncharacterized protein n=1 Tax=Deinococcus humi TaxID=662880 RepID=A0A7W8NGW2_9DEIO|nr:hypothetical protein [Deinococcus humi]MBB5365205.1 hypothetical protein [Deinococcus humi]GGO35607.1 hypothetical protein GCM10008949_38340 [Deinococcus humi]
MEEKTIGQLAEDIKGLVQHFEALCARALAHPVFPYLPDAAEYEQLFVLGEQTLRDDLTAGIASLAPVIQEIEVGLENMEKYRDQVPQESLSN